MLNEQAYASDKNSIISSITRFTVGATYPLYLLHQQIGYVLFNWIGSGEQSALLVTAVLFAITVLSRAT